MWSTLARKCTTRVVRTNLSTNSQRNRILLQPKQLCITPFAYLTKMTVLMENEAASSQIDETLDGLQSKKGAWAKLPLDEKIELLDAVRRRLLHKMASWGQIGANTKGGKEVNMVVSEMLASVALPASYIHKLLQTLRTLRATGKAPALPVRTTSSGQLAVKVFPVTRADRNNLLLPGVSAELVLLPNETTVRQAALYGKDGLVAAHNGRVCVILGAGNQGFLALKDALVCLYERGEVVVVKPHPIMTEWHKIADYVLEPLIQAGYVRTLYLDTVPLTQRLLYDSRVETVHMTGGTATHDAIVWGSSPEEQQRRRQANDPLLKVPITSELGSITPFILPGWTFTPSQLAAQAANLAMAMTNNVGCNCNSAKVLVLPADWPQADGFLEALRGVLRSTPLEPPYYPGIQERYEAFKAHYPACELITAPALSTSRPLGPALPYLINHMDGLPADPKKEYAFMTEPFAPVLTVVRLPTSGPSEFLTAATRFANEDLWGTLSCMLILHPDLEQTHPEACEKAINELQFGVVAVNNWSAASFVPGSVTWGAFVGDQSIKDVGSGLGLVSNPYLVEGVQKAVYRTPLEGPAVTKPSHMQPMPIGVAKAAMGFLVGGFRGIWGALWAR